MGIQIQLLNGFLSFVCGMCLFILPIETIAESDDVKQHHFLASKAPLVLLSANDAEIYSEFYKTHNRNPQDSITVIKLTPDKPPVTRTVYGTVHSSILGTPRMAITGNGRYGIVSNNPTTLAQLFGKEPLPKDPISLVSIIDLESANLDVLDSVELIGGSSEAGSLSMVVAHSDGERFIVNTDIALHMFRVSNGSIIKISSTKTTAPITSFDISPDGGLLLGANNSGDGLNNIDLFEITDTAIKFHGKVAVPEKGPQPFQPFSARFSPSGDIAIVLNVVGIHILDL